MAQVSGIEVKFSADTANLERGISKAQGAISGFAKGAAAALAGALSAGVFIAAGRAAINYADDIGKMAQKVGISTEALSALAYAAKLSDVSLGELQVGIQQLSKNMEAGSEGLTALGISAVDASGNLRSTNEVFLEIAESFAGMEDGAGKTAIAMNIFGRSGTSLIPMLNAGRSGLQSMTDEATRFGVIVSKDAAQAAETFNDNITRLQTAVQGLTQQAIAPLLPALTDITDALIDLAKNSPISSEAIGTINDAIKGLTVTALNAYPAIWAIGELASTAISDPLNSDAWSTSLERIRMQAEATEEAIAKIYNPTVKFDPADIETMKNAISGSDGKTIAPRLPGASTQTDTQTDADKMREPGMYREEDPFFIDRLEQIREQFKTERQVLEEEYAANREVIKNAYMNGLIADQEEYNALSEQLAKDHATALSTIQQASISQQLSDLGSGLGSMASAFQNGGKKMLRVSKAFAAAQAIVATIQAAVDAMKNPLLVDPASKFAAYATVLAKGMSAVAAIKGVSEGGGGGSGGGGGGGRMGSGGGGGTSSAPAAATPTTTFSFTLMNDPMGFGEKFARQFIDQLNSTQRNGGQIRGVIA
jgi:hypothetical protein